MVVLHTNLFYSYVLVKYSIKIKNVPYYFLPNVFNLFLINVCVYIIYCIHYTYCIFKSAYL